MGLDMYLTKKHYVKQWSHNEKNNAVTVKFDGKVRKDIQSKRISYVIEEVMYWRKANHIHNWFVQNVQKGVDDCGNYHVTTEQLTQLAELCEQVAKTRETKGLPTKSGFFFGGTEYDRYYYNDCIETAKAIRKLLKEKTPEGCWEGDYYYHSSW